jgi:hypothetical protein
LKRGVFLLLKASLYAKDINDFADKIKLDDAELRKEYNGIRL